MEGMTELVSVKEGHPCPECGAPLRVLEVKPTRRTFRSGPNEGREAGQATYRCEGNAPHCWAEAIDIGDQPRTRIGLHRIDCPPVPPTQS